MRTLALSLGCLFLLGPSAKSDSRLTMKVTPPAAMAPAGLVVRTTIESSADNRAIEVVAQSPTYYRSSQMSLDGDRAPRINEWVFRGLPAGRYEITATLVGPQGERASATKWFQATSGAGE